MGNLYWYMKAIEASQEGYLTTEESRKFLDSILNDVNNVRTTK